MIPRAVAVSLFFWLCGQPIVAGAYPCREIVETDGSYEASPILTIVGKRARATGASWAAILEGNADQVRDNYEAISKIAVAYDDAELVERISDGVLFDVSTEQKFAVLAAAALCNSPRSAKAILKLGVPPGYHTPGHTDAMATAILEGSSDVIGVLLANGYANCTQAIAYRSKSAELARVRGMNGLHEELSACP
ncbi:MULTISPECIES: hypothetical protein [Stenotrophomonas]|jgi:hypothetical protein|uniref:hypothetical protein n=1 Tax=Stenotrophomonas TaxID=40323 RepID=UPI000BD5F05B|nr:MULTISPECIES: hypothetical protein [Stenotrophomonas]MCA7023733.1 hypothetical protein [Stenotrophomonas acidaminiphila]MCE4074294.1 hypothetical protein [Stenotrophomonas acidaminiphila]OZB52749.1 MAG: hypothetical protein B7X38_07225 [Stenotrophomonas sp. 14-69-23]